MPFSIWTVITIILAIPGAVWATIQIYRHSRAPDPKAPDTLNAISSSDRSDDERVLRKFDMARAMWPGTLENRISMILRGVPARDQMPLLLFPEYVREKSQNSRELWLALAVLYANILGPQYILFSIAIFHGAFTAKQMFVIVGSMLVLAAPPIMMIRRGLNARRLSRRAARFIELQKEENALRLAFEWTAIKPPSERPGG
jgi:hypothetical protein